MKIVILFISITATCFVAGCGLESRSASKSSEQDSGAEQVDNSEALGSVPMSRFEPDERVAVPSWSTDRRTFLFAPAEYRGAWSNPVGSDLIRFVILDQSGSEEVPVQAQSLLVYSQDGAVFALDPEDADEQGRTAVYRLEDRDLAFAVQLGMTVEMQIGDRVFRGKTKPVKRPVNRQ